MLLLLLIACGPDAIDSVGSGLAGDSGDSGEPLVVTCPPDSTLTWQSFGEPMMLSWCTGCHHSALPAEGRAGAPLDINLDTHRAVQALAESIYQVSTGPEPTMPPAGGPTETERALLAEWLVCGAP